MLYILVFSIIFFLLLVFYTIQNRRKYGTFIFPLFFTLLMGGVVAWSGYNAPEEYQKLQERKEVAKNISESKTLSDEERQKLQDAYQQTTGLDAAAGLDTSMQDEQVANKLSNSLSKIGKVTFDADAHAFRIVVSENSDWYRGVAYIEDNPGKAATNGWSNVTETVKTISQQINDGFKSGYSIILQGVNNPQAELVVAKDGVIVKDFTQPE